MTTEVIDAIQLPDAVMRGASEILDDPIDIVPGYTGIETRNQKSPTRKPRRFQIGYNVKQFSVLKEIRTLYWTNGQAFGFLFINYADEALADAATSPATGDGSRLTFNIVQTFSTAARSFTRRVTRMLASSVVVKVNDVVVSSSTYSIAALGVLTFNGGSAPPNGHSVKISGRPLVPVRFDGQLETRVDTQTKISFPTANLKELFEV
jgi:uncharacterized protein (TIGR02217 family)